MSSPPKPNAARYRALTFLERGKHLFNAQRYEDALASFEQAIAADPTLTRAYTARAHAVAMMGRYKESLAACDEIIAREPDFPFGYISRGTALHFLGRDPEARAAYERAVALAPDEPLTYYNFACFLAAVGDAAACRANLARSLELDSRLNSTAAVDGDFEPYRDEDWFQELVAFKAR